MEVVQGGNAVLRAEFLDFQGNPVQVVVGSLRIYRPNGDLVLDVPLPGIVQEGVGRYRYTYGVPQNADDGPWKAVWRVNTVSGNNLLIGEEEFDVLTVNETSLNSVPSLRLLVNERIPSGGDETDTLFSDNELGLIIERNGKYLYSAAAETWFIKAGMNELLIDVDESGSNRNLEAIFKHALMMGDRYSSAHRKEVEALNGVLEGRIVGRAFSPWRRDDDDPDRIPPFSSYSTTYTRYFPIARFMFSPIG